MVEAHAAMPAHDAAAKDIIAWLCETYPFLHVESAKFLQRSYRNRGFTQNIPGYTATPLDVLAAQIMRHPNYIPAIRRANTSPQEYLKADIDCHGRMIVLQDEYRLTSQKGVPSIRAPGEPGTDPTSLHAERVRLHIATTILDHIANDVTAITKTHKVDDALVSRLTSEDIHFGHAEGAYHDVWLSIPKVSGDLRYSLANCYDCRSITVDNMAHNLFRQITGYTPPEQYTKWCHPTGYEGAKTVKPAMIIGTTANFSFVVETERRTICEGEILGQKIALPWVSSGRKILEPHELNYATYDVITSLGATELHCEEWLIAALKHQGLDAWTRATRIITRKAIYGMADETREWKDDISNEKGLIDQAELTFPSTGIRYQGRAWLTNRISITGNRLKLQGYDFSDALVEGMAGMHATDIVDHPFLEGYTINRAQMLHSQSRGSSLHVTLNERLKILTEGKT